MARMCHGRSLASYLLLSHRVRKAMKLLLIRHAESIGNQEQRIQGQTEFELSSWGQDQAQQLAQRLKAENWYPTHVYCSPLRRAVQTLDYLLQPFLQNLPGVEDPPIPVTVAPALKEIHNGILDGLTWSEAQRQYPELCQVLEASPDWYPIPGAESLTLLRDRTHQFIHTLLAQHHNRDRLWIVTHGGILQYLIAALLGCDRIWGLSMPPTSLFEFSLDLSRWSSSDLTRLNPSLWQIQRFNDSQHLEPKRSCPMMDEPAVGIS